MPTVALHPLFQLAVGVGSRALWRLVARLALFAVLMLAAAQWAGAQQNGVEFDHASTGFALSGQHRLVRCETCHINGVFKGTPRDCAVCHVQNNVRGATFQPVKHIPTALACDTCHSPSLSSFSGVLFNHIYADATGCQNCHNGFNVKGKPAAHIPTNLTCGACHNTTAFVPALKFEHNAINMAGRACASCHDGVRAKGMPGNHIPNPSALACDTCHLASRAGGFVSFAGSQFSHSGIRSNCQTCHGPDVTSASFFGVNKIVTMPPMGAPGALSHMPTSTQCENCHLASMPGDVVPGVATKTAPGSAFLTPAPTAAMIHAGVRGNCSSCHEANAVWMGVSQYPITTSVPFRGFQTRPQATAGQFNVADPTHPTGDDCSSCHSNFVDFMAEAKPANHIPMAAAAQCSSCHVSKDFSVVPELAAIHANAPSTSTNCAQCHSAGAAANFSIPAKGFAIMAPPSDHIPFGSMACETCHVGASSSLTLPVQNTAKFSNSAFSHSGITAGCEVCHGPGITGATFFGVTKIVVMPPLGASGAGSHLPSSTKCENCHLG
ncbi:MAG: multiheme c-type cytochrome, partial [Burkholderiales bacterium]|nr:multiheme c-type cytochrome [Burkholderiales bacterium]